MGAFTDLLQAKKTGDERGAFTDLLEEGEGQGAFTDLLPTPEAAAQPVRPVGPRPVAGPEFPARGLAGVMETDPRVRMYQESDAERAAAVAQGAQEIGAGFVERPHKFLPVYGALIEAERLASVRDAAQRLESGDYDQPQGWGIAESREKYSQARRQGAWVTAPHDAPEWTPQRQRDHDLKLVTDWLNEANRLRDTQDWTYTIGRIVGEMPAFMSEFLLSGGVLAPGKALTKEAVEKLTKRQVAKQAGRWALHGVARGTAMPQRTAAEYFRRRMPERVRETPEGDLEFVWPQDQPFTSFLKAYGDTVIEAASESAGEELAPLVKRFAGAALAKLPFGQKVLDRLYAGWSKLHPESTWDDFLAAISTRLGYHGVLAEVGEEYLGDSLRGITGVEDFGAGEGAGPLERAWAAFQHDVRQTPVMIASFSVPGMVRGGARMVGREIVREPGRKIPYEGEEVERPRAPLTLDELKAKLGLAELPPAHRPLEKLQQAEELAKAGGRTGLVNEHIRLYRQWRRMEPGAEQDEVAEQIYDMTRLINRIDGVADPDRGRGFVPPEMAEVERLRIEREAAAQREAPPPGRKPRHAAAQPWVEVPPRPRGTKVTRHPKRPPGAEVPEIERPVEEPVRPEGLPEETPGRLSPAQAFDAYRQNMPNATELEIVHALIEDGQRLRRDLREKYAEDPLVRERQAGYEIDRQARRYGRERRRGGPRTAAPALPGVTPRVTEPPVSEKPTSTSKAITAWGNAEREKAQGAAFDLQSIRNDEIGYTGAALWLAKHPWPKALPKQYAERVRRMAGKGMVQMMWDSKGEVYYATLEEPPNSDLLNADQMTAVEKGPEGETAARTSILGRLNAQEELGEYDEDPLTGEPILIEPMPASEKAAIANEVRQNEGEEAAQIVQGLLNKHIQTVDTHATADKIVVQVVGLSKENRAILEGAGVTVEPGAGAGEYLTFPGEAAPPAGATKEAFLDWWGQYGGWDWHEDPRTAVLEYLQDWDDEFNDMEDRIRALEEAGRQTEANELLDELDRTKVDPLAEAIQATETAKPAWDYRMWGKGTAARMIDENGQTVRRIRSTLEGKTVLCENAKHAAGIYRHGGLAIKPDGSRWAGEPAARAKPDKADAAYRAELAKTTRFIQQHPLYQAVLEGREEQAFTRTGGLRTIYVPRELASDVEAYAGQDRRKGLWRYISHDPKVQHYDEWASEVGLQDQGLDAALTRLKQLYDAEHEIGAGAVSEAVFEEAVRQGGDVELEVLAMKRSMVREGQRFEAINQAIADYVHDFAQFGGQDLSAEEQAGIIEAHQIKGKQHEAERRVRGEEGRPPGREAVAGEETPHPRGPEAPAAPAEGQRRGEVARADTDLFGQPIFRPATGTKQGELGLEVTPTAREAVPIKPELAKEVGRLAHRGGKAKRVNVPYTVRHDFEHFWFSESDVAGESALVKQWYQRVKGAAGKESTLSTGRGFSTTMTPDMHAALVAWAEKSYEEHGGDAEVNSATHTAKAILKWLAKNGPQRYQSARELYEQELLGRNDLFHHPDNPLPEMQEAWDQATKGRRLRGAGGAVGYPGRAKAHEIDRGRIAVRMEPGGKAVSARDIIDTARRAFGPTIRGKATHKMRTAAGWYDPKSWGIRLKDVRSLTTAMHEIGHYIDWHVNKRWSKKPPSAKIAAELVALGKALYGKKKPSGGYKSEGWAEFLRMYLTGEDIVAAAPALTQWFTQEYLAKEPSTAKSLATIKGMIEQWRSQGAEQRIESQISRQPIRGTVLERLERMVLWADTNWRDQLAPLRWAMKKAGLEGLSPSEDPYQLSIAFADKAPAKAREFVLHGTSDLAGNRNGPGLREIVAPVAGQIQPFTRWLFAYRALHLWKRGINPGISRADAKYVYEKYDSPVYQKAAQEITDWNHRVLLYLQQAGGITGAALARIRELNPIYVPFIRAFGTGELQMAGGVGRGVAQAGQPVKRIKGSGREIVDPFESMIQRTERILSTAQKTAVARAMALLASRPGMASLIWKVPAPLQATSFSASQIRKQLIQIAAEALGVDPGELAQATSDGAWDEILTVYTNAGRYFGKDNIVALVVNGERQFYEVAPEVYRVLEALDQYSLPWFLNATFGKATRTLRLGATGLSLSFGWVRNFIRDALTFTVLAKHAKGGPVAAVGGVAQDVLRTAPAEHFKRLGGKMSVQILQDRAATQRLRREMLATSPGRWVIHTATNPINALREIFGVPEAGTRIAEFDAALAYAEKRWGKGSLDAAVYALNQAQDVTTNFTRHGQMAKILNQMIPFFNAAIQGPDKMLRTFRARPVATTLKAIACLTVPALVAWWRSKDEEWYRRLTDQEKANYLHFRVPGTETIVRIPVPFEPGYLFQSLPVAALDQLYRDDPDQVKEIFGEAAERSNPFDWPALVGPVIDVMRNRTWTGRPVITEAMKNTLPEDRYYPYTTELMKFVGRQLGYSPAQIEYLVDQYSGGLYGRSARAIDLAVGERAQNRTVADIPAIGTLFLREPYRPAEKIERFYDRLEVLRQKRGSRKISGREERERAALESYSRRYLSPLWKELRKGDLPEDRKRQLYARMERVLDRAERLRPKEK